MIKKISQIFLFIFKPIYTFLFKYIILPIYNILYLTKKRIKQHSTNQLKITPLNFFINKYLLYIFILILSSSVIFNNLKIKTIAAEDLGKKSLLYQLSQGDEFTDDIVVKKVLEINNEHTPHNLTQSTNNDFLTLNKTTITKNEELAKELKTQDLYKSNSEKGLVADTLLKTSSPSTFNTPQPRSNIQTYTIQSGDTISSIAKKFNISISTVLLANNLTSNSVIRPGKKLTILPTNGIIHKIKKGDTLSAIAKKYGVEQNKILDYNNLVSINQLSIDQTLIIPGGKIKNTYYAKRSTPRVSNIFKAPSSQKKSGGFIWPAVSHRITQYYHWKHHAIDIGGKLGSPLYASKAGKIIRARWGRGYGNYIIIDHGDGTQTLYAHQTKFYVHEGDYVKQGQVIGALGSTGWSTGPHVHFEIMINCRRNVPFSGKKVNPLSYL